MIQTILYCALAVWPLSAGERVTFSVAPGVKLAKRLRANHELQVERMGMTRDDGPFMSDGSGGWISSTQRLDFVDEYVACDDVRATQLVRNFLDIEIVAKATITRGSNQQLDEKSLSTSQLRYRGVALTWVAAENDWSRRFSHVEGDEEVLIPIRGEADLLGLLPGREVEVGDTWEIAPARMREAFAPSGELSVFPTQGNLFGRLVELGLGGDFADFLSPDSAGSVTATFKGVREITLAADDPADDQLADEGAEPDDGAGEQSAVEPAPAAPSKSVRVGVIELDIQLASLADRTQLYFRAMPETERREQTRLESVPFEYTLHGKGELLWDLAGGHFHSLSITGQESFDAQVIKTQFVGGREQFKYAQQSRYSGTLNFQLSARDGAGVDTSAPAKPEPKTGKTPPKKRKK